ncbi:MAG TPA: low affinity iron permease family protein [Arthrobacter sp.]|nr:low affinity iron permease family protein [Arthrobacter sp.]
MGIRDGEAGTIERFADLPRMAGKAVRTAITEVGTLLARPWAFIVFGLYTVAWLALDRSSLGWHGVATLATWAMTLFIQRAEHRDTQAIHAKLDELLRTAGREKLTTLDEEEPEEIEDLRERDQGDDAQAR